TAVLVLLGDADHEAQVRAHQLLDRLLVARACATAQLDLLLRRDQLVLADLPEILIQCATLLGGLPDEARRKLAGRPATSLPFLLLPCIRRGGHQILRLSVSRVARPGRVARLRTMQGFCRQKRPSAACALTGGRLAFPPHLPPATRPVFAARVDPASRTRSAFSTETRPASEARQDVIPASAAQGSDRAPAAPRPCHSWNARTGRFVDGSARDPAAGAP